MKKIISLVLVLVVCLSLACPAFAAETTFVPSISYKDGPDADSAKLKDENVGSCLVITSITEAKNKATDITQEDRDLLLDVYDQLKTGAMKLPLENNKYVIRELVDVNFKANACGRCSSVFTATGERSSSSCSYFPSRWKRENMQ